MSLRFLSRFGRQCLAVSGVKRLPLRVFSWEMWAQTSRCINFHCFLLLVGQDLCPLIPIRHQSESANSELRSPLHPVGSLQGETPRCPVEVYGNQRPGPSCLTGEDQQNPPGEVPGIPWKSMEYMYKNSGLKDLPIRFISTLKNGRHRPFN